MSNNVPRAGASVDEATNQLDAAGGQAIHALLPAVMEDVGIIAKSQTNAERNYQFRSLDDVLNAIQPVLVSHGICTSVRCFDHRLQQQRLRDRYGNERAISRASLMLELTFWARDGSNIASIAAGEGQDVDGDKATGKAMASAMKYAMLFGLVIPAGPDQRQ